LTEVLGVAGLPSGLRSQAASRRSRTDRRVRSRRAPTDRPSLRASRRLPGDLSRPACLGARARRAVARGRFAARRLLPADRGLLAANRGLPCRRLLP